MSDEREEDLHLDKLASGDRPAIYALGMVGTHALKVKGVCVFMVDVLGRVQLMPPESVEVKAVPRLRDDELDVLPEEEAIQLLVAQGDPEDVIIDYLKTREQRTYQAQST